MNEYYKSLLSNKEKMRNSFSWISDEQFDFVKQNFHDLECDLKAFISYSNKDKEIAAMIKSALSNLGISSFLAHEDISPSQDWQGEIINQLNTCNIFVPLINENFKESEWTSQEAGAAFIRAMHIVPVSVHLPNQPFIDPYGFISKFQALKLTIDPDILSTFPGRIVSDIQHKIAQALKLKSTIIEKVRNCFVNSLVNSISFADANSKAESISQLAPFGKQRLRMIVFAYTFNDQIRNANRASGLIEKLVKDNITELDDIARSIFEGDKP